MSYEKLIVDVFFSTLLLYLIISFSFQQMQNCQMLSIPVPPILKDDLKRVYTIPGLDYICHDDIIPYRSNGRSTFKHCLFDYFFDERTYRGKINALFRYLLFKIYNVW